MLIEQAIIAALKGQGVTDAGDSVYPELEPDEAASSQCAYPLVVYDEQESENVAHLGGNTGIVKAVYGIDCRGISDPQCKKLRKQVQKILDNFCGTLGGINIKRINAKKTQAAPHPATSKHIKFFSAEVTAEIWFFDPDTQ